MRLLIKELLKSIYRFLFKKEVRTFYRLLAKAKRMGRFKFTKQLKFLVYKFDVPDMESFAWQFKEIFIDRIYEFETSNEQPVIIDCGTNIGTSLLFFSKIYSNARILGFEADDTIAKICSSNMDYNEIHNVEFIKKAVWIDNKGITFSTEGADGGAININGKNTTYIPTVRLRDYLLSEKRIDFLKMDIEGAEYEVLKDCSSSLAHIQNIFIEYHSKNSEKQQLGEIVQFLSNANFRVYIQNEQTRVKPLVNKSGNGNFDMQLNIFGYRV